MTEDFIEDTSSRKRDGYVGVFVKRDRIKKGKTDKDRFSVSNEQEQVFVWERDAEGKRRCFIHNYEPYFYVPHENGERKTLWGDRVTKLSFQFSNEAKFAAEMYERTFESDFSALDRILMDRYYNVPPPNLHIALIDIETDYDPLKPFSKPQCIQELTPSGKKVVLQPDPEVMYAPINAITIFKHWLEEYVTIVVPPKGWTGELPKKMSLADIGSSIESRLVVVEDEVQLLKQTLKELYDCDVMSGWNSEFFDMPYLIMRTQILQNEGKSINVDEWSLPGAGKIRYSVKEFFGSEKAMVDINSTGRAHLDYLRLFQKFTFEGRASYSLAAIAEEELDIPKLEYEGSLADLYNNDFLHFIKYNIRDVEILHRLDEKFKFINLANMMSHENTVLIDTVLGTVRYVETGLTNYAHNVLDRVVGNKPPEQVTSKVEGAIVLTPKIGLHPWVGSVDINSLYPSVIRSLNISPEKILGQFVNGEDDWIGIKNKDQSPHVLTLESGEEVSLSGEEWFKVLIDNQWAISAYGTVFDQANGKGLIPTVLEDWYFGRKKLQAEKKKWTKIRKSMEDEGKDNTPEYEDACKQEEYFDLLQLTRKIQLNSTYGALLNAFFRYFRMEMGASVTATGRAITSHMIGTIGELLTGVYSSLHSYTEIDNKGKVMKFYETAPDSPVIYGDTDSSYFLTYASSKEEAVEIADTIAEGVNASFPQFMIDSFNCQKPDFHDLIKAGREIVAIRGLFQAKKKYMLKVVDLEGVATDKMKSMGSEIKKADTPKPIQKFLKHTVDLILDGRDYDFVEKHVNAERKNLFSKSQYDDIINLGVARAANNLDEQYSAYKKYEKTGKTVPHTKSSKVRLPGHIRAAVNYNELALQEEGPGATMIQSGDKVKVFYLRDNPRHIKSIAFPADISKFPRWFDEQFRVDVKLTEEKMIDAKLEGIFSAWGYEVPTVQGAFIKTIIEF